MKRCPTCQTEKPLAEFYADKRTADGLKSQCKRCHGAGNVRTRDRERHRETNRQYMRRARRLDTEKFQQRERVAGRERGWDERREARYQLHLALRRGEIARPGECERCKTPGPVEGHHPDYAKPLEVEWLCTLCHGKEHRHVA